MAFQSQVELNSAQVFEVERMLAGIKDGAPRALNAAINRSVVQAQARAVDYVYAELNLTKKVIRAFTKVYKSTFSTLQAHLTVFGSYLPIYTYFAAKVLTTGGVSAKIRRAKGTERWYWRFQATMRSGHTGIYERDLSKPRRELRANVWGSTVLPIEEAVGPSIPSVFEHNGYQQQIAITPTELQNNLDAEVERILRGYF